MYMRRFAGIVFLRLGLSSSFFLCYQVCSQDIPVGTWRTHFSYHNARLLEKTSDKIFCSVENGLFSYDLSDNSIRKLSKIDGLSDAGVSAMQYNPTANVLVIGYRSGLADFVSQTDISTLREIALSNLDGDKEINDIAFFDNRTFLATGLGIVVVNSSETTIQENLVQIGVAGVEVEVFEIEILGDVLFAKTNQGIQHGTLTNNLLDFNNWNHHPGTSGITNIVTANDEVYAISGLDLFQFNANSWNDTGIDLPVNASGLYSVEERLLTATDQSIFELTGSQFTTISSITNREVNDINIVNGEYWLADGQLGVLTSSGNSISPAGPLSDQYSRLRIIGTTTYGFHAPNPATYDGSIGIDNYSTFSEGEWSNEQIPDFKNVSDVAQFGGVLYFSSIGDGLYNQTTEEIIEDVPQSNVSLDTVISALSSGEELWVSSYGNSTPIHQFNGEQWTSFSSALLLGNEYIDLATSLTGIFWGRTNNGRIVVFNSEENRVLLLGGLPGLPEDFEISIEDNAWIATSEGPATFADASFIFQSNEVILPSFESSVLFENEQVNAIETDGGNRTWFGTDRGLWVFSENTTEQIALFDIDNSPIPSNKVLDLTYNEQNGEMFVITDKGMVSYRSASSVGSGTHQNVNVFPNPVLPEYNGLVGIQGLAKNTSIKITDINGNLVKEINANGSSASWDLKNVGNSEVVTGVYLIFSSSSDGEETYVGKIAVIR